MSSSLPGVQPLDRFDLKLSGEIVAHPSGEWLVYQRVRADVSTDGFTATLWRVNADGSEHQPLQKTSGAQSCPRFSADGSQLAWIDTDTGSAQIHLAKVVDGQLQGAAVISTLDSAPSLLSWSPCGQWLAFYQSVAVAQPSFVDITTNGNWAPPPIVTQDLPYKLDGVGYLPHSRQQLFVLRLGESVAMQVSDEAEGVGEVFFAQMPEWSPDSKRILAIACSANSRLEDDRDTDVYAWSLPGSDAPEKTFGKKPEKIKLSNFAGYIPGFALSPCGKKLAFTGVEHIGQGCMVFDAYVQQLGDNSAEALQCLSEGMDLSIADQLDNYGKPLLWNQDSSAVYALYDQRGNTKLGRFALSGEHSVIIEALCQGSSGYGAGTAWAMLDQASEHCVYTRGLASEWPELWAQSNSREAEAITAMNDSLRRQRELAQVRHLEFSNPKDGLALEAWLYTPPGFDPNKRYPMILEIHGGPHQNFGPRFWPRLQTMAAAGYCILMMNPRGSTSYGHDFANSIQEDYPNKDAGDLLAGVDAACAFDFVDSDRLFVTGISGGGTLTTALVAETDRFSAAAALCPFVEHQGLRLGADVAPYIRHMMPKLPWEAPELYARLSTINRVGSVSTPTMLQGGELDHRTPMSHAELYYQALKFRGIDTVLVHFAGENHGTSMRPSHGMQSLELVLNWFAHYDPAKQ